ANGQPLPDSAAPFAWVSGPIRTPSDWTIWVSYALVSIAISYPHLGHAYTTDSDPRSGGPTVWSFIGLSQGTHRNFIGIPHSDHSAAAARSRPAQRPPACRVQP